MPKPPDLSRCTHLEILLYSDIFYRFGGVNCPYESFFSAAETEYLKSLSKVVIDDKEIIRRIARAVSSGTYKVSNTEYIELGTYNFIIPRYAIFDLLIEGYRNDESISKFTICKPSFILTLENKKFKLLYDEFPQIYYLLISEKTKPLVYRMLCGTVLRSLKKYFSSESFNSYPLPTEWCDTIIRDITPEREIGEIRIKRLLMCPSSGQGKCHYAMNPNCKPDSPPDMVLLFETKAGWNQHGGSELFTFDNHDPKGGCVLLNNGTVKFIRTKEELNNLRWK